MAQSLNDAVFKFFLNVTDWQTDRPRLVWRSWQQWVWRITPSHLTWSVSILLRKLSIKVYRLRLSVFTHFIFHTSVLWYWWANTETENNQTWFLGPTRVLNPNSTSIGWAVIEGFTTVTDGETDRPCRVQRSWRHRMWRITPSHSAWSVDMMGVVPWLGHRRSGSA